MADITEGQNTTSDYRPEVQELLNFFAYGHLPEYLQRVSKEFAALAYHVADMDKGGSQTITALEFLLYAKDAAVRAVVSRETGRMTE